MSGHVQDTAKSINSHYLYRQTSGPAFPRRIDCWTYSAAVVVAVSVGDAVAVDVGLFDVVVLD